MTWCGRYSCSCCEKSYASGLSDGFKSGFAKGYDSGYVSGYIDGYKHDPPQLAYRQVIEEKLFPLRLGCGCYDTCTCIRYVPPTPVYTPKMLSCGCYGTCVCVGKCTCIGLCYCGGR